SDPQHESPVRADPGDILLLAGAGFAPGAAVAYQAISDTTSPASAPPFSLSGQSPLQGLIAPLVSPDASSHAVKAMLPTTLIADQSYELWVGNPNGDGTYSWSNGVLVNDARPMWMTPGARFGTDAPFTYQTEDRGVFDEGGRYLKVVG